MTSVIVITLSVVTVLFCIGNSIALRNISKTNDRRIDFIHERLNEMQFPAKRMHPGGLPQPRQRD